MQGNKNVEPLTDRSVMCGIVTSHLTALRFMRIRVGSYKWNQPISHVVVRMLLCFNTYCEPALQSSLLKQVQSHTLQLLGKT